MDKNFFIALTAALLVFFGYNTFTTQKQIETKQEQINQQINIVKEKQASISTKLQEQNSVSLKTAKKQETEKLFTVETEHAKIVFTSKGAAIKDFIYRDFNTDLNLTPFGNEGYFATLPEVYFEQTPAQNGADIAFKTKIADGVFLVKTYTINKEQGLNKLELSFKNERNEELNLSDLYLNMGPGLNTVKSEISDNAAILRAFCARQESGKKNISVNNLKAKTFTKPGLLKETCDGWKWAGIDNRYFLTALIPTNWQGVADGFKFSKHFMYETPSFFGLFGKTRAEGPDLKILLPAVLPANQTVTYSSDFYIGPKDLNLLESLPYDLQRSIQFGFFGQLGKWMRNILEWLNKYTHNYGFAIILMTFLIQIILFPLTYKQLKSAAVMQRIQPQMKVIQEKYKSDPMRAQQEMIALYKKYGANPLSGCLPLFIQMPIFIALFNALRTSWALHGSPFIWWITDLSAKDPYYVLPILMGVIMFIQQKITMPENMTKDNPSMAMMKWMPVFMTVIFLNFPAGLTLYWFISNCISFVVNLILKRKLAAI